MLHPRAGVLALVANYDEGHVERLGVFDTVRAYDRSFGDTLEAWLRELRPTTILLNYSESDHLCDGLTHGQFLRISALAGKVLPDARLEASEPFLTRVRGVKTPEELRRRSSERFAAATTSTPVFVRSSGSGRASARFRR